MPGASTEAAGGRPQKLPAGEAGPLRLRTVRHTVRAWLPGERSVKTARAAGLAWGAGVLLGNPRPYFAPLAAILVLQVTIAESVARAVQRVIGVVVGVLLALVVGRLLGLTAWGSGIPWCCCAWRSARACGWAPRASPRWRSARCW